MILGLTLCSVSLLLIALYFQYILGLQPCKLCIWQRVPHVVIIILSFFGLINFKLRPSVCLSCLVLILANVFLSGYHVGIEYKLWNGPQSCSQSETLSNLSPEKFLEVILNAPVVQCDIIAWSFLNISMAGWHFILCSFLTVGWLQTTRHALTKLS